MRRLHARLAAQRGGPAGPRVRRRAAALRHAGAGRRAHQDAGAGGLREGGEPAEVPPPPRESETQVGRPATLERQRGRGAARTEAEEVLGERREGAQVGLQ